MYAGEYKLSFKGHVVFHHSTTKVGPFNEVRSLEAPQVTTIYGALAQTASMMGLDPSILEKTSLTPPTPESSIVRNMLIHTAPLSPFDWQPKWVNREGEYAPLSRVFPRKVFALWRPRYSMSVFAQDDEARDFVQRSFRLLADRSDGEVGADLGLGYKKKLFGAFDCQSEWSGPLKELNIENARIVEVLSDCPSRFNNVVPLQPKIMVLTYRNVHRTRGLPPVVSCSVYAPGSIVLLKEETPMKWYRYRDEALGISEMVERRWFGEGEVKAVQGLFLTHG